MAVFINTSLTSAGNISGDTFIFDNTAQYFVRSTGGNIDHNTIIFGSGQGDSVQIQHRGGGPFLNIEHNTIIFGNGADDKVTNNAGSINNNTITFGNGNNDSVSSASFGAVSNNTITFGNGNGNNVIAGTSGMHGNKITFGSGDGNFVNGVIDNNIITFGDGAGNHVGDGAGGTSGINVEHNIITFGNGAGDKFEHLGLINNNVITFGDGARDSLSTQWGGSNNVITFGNGDNVTISFGDFTPVGAINNNMFTVGNGDNATITLGDGSVPISNNTITVGNGNNGAITLSGNGGGGNTIVTGTGFNVTVNAGTHTSPDMFGFSLGTSGAGFTTVSGARNSDLITASGTALGNNLVSNDFTDATTLREFITTLNFQENDSTAIGYNQSVNDTFIVTLAADGQLGAVVMVGQFLDSTITNHVLTLIG